MPAFSASFECLPAFIDGTSKRFTMRTGAFLDKVYSIEYTINMNEKILKIAVIQNDKAPFLEWLNSLDKSIKARVQSRLTRILENNFGDCKK